MLICLERVPIVEDLVPHKVIGKRFGYSRKQKDRRCLWRKLGRTKKKLLCSTSVKRTANLLQCKQMLEKQLKLLYDTQGRAEENKVVKAFFAYGQATGPAGQAEYQG
jgi:hypothetical protein